MNNVEDYYNASPQREWERMERHPMEFHLTRQALKEYLPPPPAYILDVGGGPGRYAIALAAQGYTVSLFDLSGSALALAREKAQAAGVTLADVIQGSATNLAHFTDCQFDAVLLMGPLYHLLEVIDREQAVREALRVLKPGMNLFAAFVQRFTPAIALARQVPEDITKRCAQLEHILATGIYAPATGEGFLGDGFTDAYFIAPDSIASWMTGFDLQTLEVIGTEGISLFTQHNLDVLPHAQR